MKLHPFALQNQCPSSLSILVGRQMPTCFLMFRCLLQALHERRTELRFADFLDGANLVRLIQFGHQYSSWPLIVQPFFQQVWAVPLDVFLLQALQILLTRRHHTQ